MIIKRLNWLSRWWLCEIDFGCWSKGIIYHTDRNRRFELIIWPDNICIFAPCHTRSKKNSTVSKKKIGLLQTYTTLYYSLCSRFYFLYYVRPVFFLSKTDILTCSIVTLIIDKLILQIRTDKITWIKLWESLIICIQHTKK